MLSICACDALQLRLAQTLQVVDAVDETRYPSLHRLQNNFFHNEVPNSVHPSSSLSASSALCVPETRHQFLTSLEAADATTVVPFGRPSLQIKFLGRDVFYSFKMLACLEMPGVTRNRLPELQWATNLYDMILSERVAYSNATDNGSFTASDVKQVVYDFARSSDELTRWLCKTRRVPRATKLTQTTFAMRSTTS